MKSIKVVVKENEEKIIPFVWINGKEKEMSIDVELLGDGARVEIVGLFLGTKTNEVTFNTRVVHTGLKTYSRTNLAGVMLGHAAINNDAMIRINKNAKGADGYFTSKILLFDDAKGKSVPSLEIDENDLKAGHASTIGRPDAEQLFYMQSRGLSELEAQQLIIAGFFSPIIEKLPEKEKKAARKKIDEVLEYEAIT